MAKKKVQDQGERILRIEAYIRYAAMTKDEAQRRYGAFYEAIKGLYLETVKRWYQVDRKSISLIRFVFEGYEGIATVTTVDSATGQIVLCIAPGCESDVEAVLLDLQTQIYMEPISETSVALPAAG